MLISPTTVRCKEEKRNENQNQNQTENQQFYKCPNKKWEENGLNWNWNKVVHVSVAVRVMG